MSDLQIDVKSELPVISFNKPALVSWARSLIEKFKGLVVTESDIQATKKDMAEINKHRQLLGRARIDTVKALKAPLDAFEAEVKDVDKILADAHDSLQIQVKAFEDKERDEKEQSIMKWILMEQDEADVDLAIPIQAKWLNKTVRENQIRHDIQEIIAKHKEQEKQRLAYETAKKERIETIEQHVKQKNEATGCKFSCASFMTAHNMSISTPVAEVFTIINKQFEMDVERIRLEKERIALAEQERKETKAQAESAQKMFAERQMQAAKAVPVARNTSDSQSPVSNNTASESKTVINEPQGSTGETLPLLVTYRVELTFPADKMQKVESTLEWLKKLGVDVKIEK